MERFTDVTVMIYIRMILKHVNAGSCWLFVAFFKFQTLTLLSQLAKRSLLANANPVNRQTYLGLQLPDAVCSSSQP